MRNNSNVPSRGPATQRSAAPAAQSGGQARVLPQYILKFKDADGSIKTLTGLFESVSKKGQTYFSGKDRESGVTYYVMTNDKAAK
jgi:hypothetical protein